MNTCIETAPFRPSEVEGPFGIDDQPAFDSAQADRFWIGGLIRGGLVGTLLVLAACAHQPDLAPRAADLVVIAPHPDDEVLLAAGLIERSVQAGERVHVILLTNGDATCERDGTRRQGETVAAMRALGVPEEHLHFLGYPDGALDRLSREPLGPLPQLDPHGACVQRATTWAVRGQGGVDEHTRATGSPAAWTSTALVEDLARLLGVLRPRLVVVPHGLDAHPDHATTYVFFRRALDTLDVAPLQVLRGVVHAGRCWPSDCATFFTPDAGWTPLPPPLERYRPGLAVPVDARKKLASIARYPSQTGPEPEKDWLASFARKEEPFFAERLVRDGARWVQRGSVPAGPDERVLRVGPLEELNAWGPDGFRAAGVRLTAPSPAAPPAAPPSPE
jgi:LmbE family N-acetylglucosaminyl deacetylase